MAGFPSRRPGVLYLTEGGPETEILHRCGRELPGFALYPLLDDPAAMAELRAMYGAVLEVAAAHGFHAMISGLDYRASPDWGRKLGYSRARLGEALERSIAFLRDVARPYRGRVPKILIGGVLGPREDAYAPDRAVTAEEAEAYHGWQLEALRRLEVDFVGAATFNNVPEAVGVARAAARVGLPLTVSFTLERDHRLRSGPSLKAAIEAVDAEAGDARPDFYGINCSHPLEFGPALEPGDWILRLRSLRPNASAKNKAVLAALGRLDDGDPVDLGRRMGELARRHPHIDVWGGCCGAWDRHLHEIAAQVRGAASDRGE